ncbi:hypothetical protein EGM70_07630 [Enterobacteriaceae bacterium 89]|nr:hypothetical protein [Enterobacteriaceae bacterium 89]
MNYQTSALWFYHPFYFLAFLLCLACTFLGFSSPIFYMLIAGLVLPVIVSMRLHTLSESGNAWLMKERSDWQVYVNGIPVQEQRSTLSNPCFTSPQRLQQFYLRAFICKLVIQLAALIMLLNQGKEAAWLSIEGLAEGIIFCALVLIIVSTVRTLRMISAQQWQIQAITSTAGSHWYQAFFVGRKQAQSALGRLCSLV